MVKPFNIGIIMQVFEYQYIKLDPLDEITLTDMVCTYPPQSHKFKTKFPRNLTCECSTSTKTKTWLN